MKPTRTVKLFLALLLCVFITACSRPAQMSNLNEEDIRTVPDLELCEAYYYGRADNVRNEINRRNLIREARWTMVDSNKITPGMSECATFASLGSPKRIEAETAEDEMKVLVYRQNNLLIRVYCDKKRITRVERRPS